MTIKSVNFSELHLGEKGALYDLFEEMSDDPVADAEYLSISFVEEILEAAEKEGISREEIAKRMGVSKAGLSSIFNCSPRIWLSTLNRLAFAVNRRMVIELVRKDVQNG